MILSTPSPLSFGPSSSSVQPQPLVIDLSAKTITFSYGPAGAGGPGQSKSISHVMPAALQTAILSALEAHVQTSIETNEGLAPGSTTITAT